MKKTFITCIALLWFNVTFAQVGVGTANPKVNLDARGAGNSAVGIGATNQIASDAGEGAIKYDPAGKRMMYSDGTNWVELAGNQANVFVPKVVASGRSTAQQTVAGGGVFRTWNFGGIQANDGNWNATTNIYTVPTNGFYQLSIAGGIQASQNNNTSGWIIQINNNGIVQYSIADQGPLATIYTASKGGTIVLYLNAGTTIAFGSNHCLGCNNPAENYLIKTGATFSIVSLGS